MKKRFKYRKELIEIANELGLTDVTHNAVFENPITKIQSFQLINNHRRFVRGILKMTPERQKLRIEVLRKRMAAAREEAAAKASETSQGDAQ